MMESLEAIVQKGETDEKLDGLMYSCPAFHRINRNTMAMGRPIGVGGMNRLPNQIGPASSVNYGGIMKPPMQEHYEEKIQTIAKQTPFQSGVDLPETGVQMHFHGEDNNNLAFGHLKTYNQEHLAPKLDSYQSAMADYYAQMLDLKKF